jgi:hypothetical protein
MTGIRICIRTLLSMPILLKCLSITSLSVSYLKTRFQKPPSIIYPDDPARMTMSSSCQLSIAKTYTGSHISRFGRHRLLIKKPAVAGPVRALADCVGHIPEACEATHKIGALASARTSARTSPIRGKFKPAVTGHIIRVNSCNSWTFNLLHVFSLVRSPGLTSRNPRSCSPSLPHSLSPSCRRSRPHSWKYYLRKTDPRINI